jgi:hypothetical protein
MPDPAVVFRRPFDEQVAFFRGKLGNLVPTKKWDDIKKSAHDRAFMVAGAAKADLLADLAAAVDKAIAEGETLEAFRGRFLEIVRRHGWAGWTGDDRKTPDDKGGKGVAWRTRVIYQTNLATSYAAGRLAQLKEAGYRYWVYKHSDSVAHPRPQHLAWNGLTLPADHPFWQSHYPPNGWNCFPGSTPVRCDALLGQRVWYAGEIVEIHAASGNRVAVTPNHPILTGRGWVAAQSLQQGDELLCASPDINTPLSWIVHDEHAPTCAEDLFETLAAQGFRVIPVATHDFHGDALGMEGEIHIAGADRHLVHIVESARGEGFGKIRLDGALGLPVEATHTAMRDSEDASILAKPAASQHLLNGWLGHAKPQRDLPGAGQSAAVQADGDAFGIGVARIGSGPRLDKVALAPAVALLDTPPDDPVRIASPAQIDPGLSQCTSDGLTAAAALLRQLLDANPGKVLLDHVIEIRKFDWSGHVYDFTTSTGLILAGGIVVSNCRCRVVGANGGEGAKLLGGDPGYNTPPAGWDAIDPKTKEPVGIDKGWGYMPGRKAEAIKAIAGALSRFDPVMADLAATFAGKTVAWPYELAKAYMGGVPAEMRDALARAVRAQPETGEAVRRYAQAALAGRPVDPYRTMGLLTMDESARIAEMTGVEALKRELFDWVIDKYAPLHVRAEHGDDAVEQPRGQRAVTAGDYARLPAIILAPDRIWVEDGGKTLLLERAFDGERQVAAFGILNKRRMVALKSMRVIRRAPRAQRP